MTGWGHVRFYRYYLLTVLDITVLQKYGTLETEYTRDNRNNNLAVWNGWNRGIEAIRDTSTNTEVCHLHGSGYLKLYESIIYIYIRSRYLWRQR